MVEIYDIETYNDAFIVCSIDKDTLLRYTYEISYRKDDREELIKHLHNLKGQIGFNNLNFDYPVLHWFLNNHTKYDQHILPNVICNKAQELIKSETPNVIYKGSIVPQLDLYKIWHFDNKAKATSLKYLEFTMRSSNIEDLPYGIYDKLTSNMIDEIIEYCHHDVTETYKFYKITIGDTDLPLYKGKNKIQFRIDMSKRFGKDFMNFNDVKIGEEINKLTYLKLTNKKWWDIKDLKTNRTIINIAQLIPTYIIYKNKTLQNILNNLKKDHINCYAPKLRYEFKFADNIWSLGLGGIHTQDKPRNVKPKENQMFNERDVGSMYPNKIIEATHPVFNTKGLYPAHLGIEWLVGYTNNRDTRLNIKSLKDKNSTQVQEIEVLKLAMNGGGYGKTGEETNWQFDPLVKFTTTIQCQLDILLLADMLWETGLIEIESGNTDGINILYDKKYDDKINNICKEWEKITNASLETTEYSQVIRTSVNDYMAIKPDGKIKFKGDFEIEKELHKNDSFRIIPIAINEYFINNILVEETIRNHTDIFDFCACIRSRKTAKKGNSWYELHSINGADLEIQKLSKTVRYFLSTNGKYLVKRYEDGSSAQVEASKSVGKFKKDWKVTYFNKSFELNNIKEYSIDYIYYISKAKDWIRLFEKQPKLF